MLLKPSLGFGTPWPSNSPASYGNVTLKDCGGLFNHSSGIAQSPGYPHEYESSLNCVYVFQAKPDQVVNVRFTFFDVDEDINNRNCIFDYITAHDGPHHDSPSLGTAMCGGQKSKPNDIMSSGSSLTILFHTSEDYTMGQGFEIEYHMIERKKSEEVCRTNVCGGTFENFNGCEFQTLNYPKEYLPNQNCTWQIHAPRPQDTLEIKFKDFRIDTSLYCTLDHMAVFDGSSINSNIQLGNNLCKEIVAKNIKFTTTGPYMTVNFWTHNETLAERHDRTSEIDHLFGISFHVRVIPGPDPTTTKATTTTTTIATTTTAATTTTYAKTISTSVNEPEVVPVTVSTKQSVTSTKVSDESNNDKQQGTNIISTKMPASTMSGLVVGLIVLLLVVVLAVFCVVAFVHWKRQNYRIRLRADDTNGLITNMEAGENGVAYHKVDQGRIVRTNQMQDLNDSQL